MSGAGARQAEARERRPGSPVSAPPPGRGARREPGALGWRLGPLRALGVANARYWPTVAPLTAAALARWRAPAQEIADPRLRALALEKLDEEAFNAQVATTLATLAPPAQRAGSVEAIVALELLFDYLDGRTEQLGEQVLIEAAVLFAPFTQAVRLEAGRPRGAQEHQQENPRPDWSYLTKLGSHTRERFATLPGAGTVSPLASAALERCAQAQTRIHAIDALGLEQLREWSQAAGEGSGLGWREYAAGCASSVLAAHALIAVAADPGVSLEGARQIDSIYLASAAAITILDSLVDAAEDRAHGRSAFTSLYEPGELEQTLPALVREALARASQAPQGAHHAMTLAGVVAYYTSHPGARHGQARRIARALRAELSPTVWPALAVMHLWRGAKAARRLARPARADTQGQATAAHKDT